MRKKTKNANPPTLPPTPFMEGVGLSVAGRRAFHRCKRKWAQRGKVFGDGAPIHHADRKRQTDQMRNLWNMKRHDLVLLPGAQEEAHGMFLARLERLLPKEPTCQVIHVHWGDRTSPEIPQFPTGENELLGAFLSENLILDT